MSMILIVLDPCTQKATFIKVKPSMRNVVGLVDMMNLQSGYPGQKVGKAIDRVFKLLGGERAFEVSPKLGEVVSQQVAMTNGDWVFFWYD